MAAVENGYVRLLGTHEGYPGSMKHDEEGGGHSMTTGRLNSKQIVLRSSPTQF